jgi:hypothetical protein
MADDQAYPGDTPTWGHVDLTGYTVEGVDGEVGTVTESVHELDDRAVITVRIGLPLVGREVVLPVALIEQVDNDDRRIRLAHTRAQVEQAPDAGD